MKIYRVEHVGVYEQTTDIEFDCSNESERNFVKELFGLCEVAPTSEKTSDHASVRVCKIRTDCAHYNTKSPNFDKEFCIIGNENYNPCRIPCVGCANFMAGE